MLPAVTAGDRGSTLPSVSPAFAPWALVLYLTAALLAVVPQTGRAQSIDAAAGASKPPARIDNHYNHKAYQPTTGEICGRATSDGIDCPSPAGKEAEKTLDSVRRQLDELAKEYPAEAPTAGR